MILTFKPQFVEPIKAGTKIHTIREDKKGRWKPGTKIQFWNGNPRNVKAKPHQFQSGICTHVEDIIIDFVWDDVLVYSRNILSTELHTRISKLNKFAQDDGFEDWKSLKQWFENEYPQNKMFTGKLIYFKVHATI